MKKFLTSFVAIALVTGGDAYCAGTMRVSSSAARSATGQIGSGGVLSSSSNNARLSAARLIPVAAYNTGGGGTANIDLSSYATYSHVDNVEQRLDIRIDGLETGLGNVYNKQEINNMLEDIGATDRKVSKVLPVPKASKATRA